MKRLFLSMTATLFVGMLFLAPPAHAAEDINIITPEPQVQIPGLQFSRPDDIKRDEVLSDTGEDSTFTLQIPFIGQYIAAIYRYAIAIAVIISIVMIIVAGFQWAFSGGSQDAIGSAKKRIINAVTGLILVAGSYTILYTINPDLVRFRSLSLTYIRGIPDDRYSEQEIEHLEGNTYARSEVGDIIATGVRVSRNAKGKIPQAMIDDLKKVGLLMNGQKIGEENLGIIITSGYRSIDHQIRLINDNCSNPPGSKKGCDPKPGKPLTCILKDMKPSNCPHTTGAAVDVWGTVGGRQCILQGECSRNKDTDACRQNECQKKLIQYMKAEGFCVLDKEAWHFERPIVSQNRRTGEQYCN